MSILTAMIISRAAQVDPAPLISDGSDVLLTGNDGNMWIRADNPTAGTITLTAKTTATVSGQALAAVTIPAPPGGTVWAGPWPPVLFNDATETVTFQGGSGLALRAYGI